MWIEKAKEFLRNLIDESKEIIETLNSEKLDFIVEYIMNRKR